MINFVQRLPDSRSLLDRRFPFIAYLIAVLPDENKQVNDRPNIPALSKFIAKASDYLVLSF